MILEIRGIAELIGGLKKSADLNDVKRIVAMNGSEMQTKMKRYAPNDTGNLERLINLRAFDNNYSVSVKSSAEYAPYQEYGTRYQSGTAHVRPAFYEQRSKFIKDMKRIMK